MVQPAKLMGTPDEIYRYRDGLQDHCGRVATLATELGAFLDLETSEKQALHRAALLHHVPGVLSGTGMTRLLRDTLEARGSSLPPGTGGGAFDLHPLARQILDICNAFDEEMEFLPYDDRPTAQVVAEFARLEGPSYWSLEVRRAWHELARISEGDLFRAAAQLPVFPKVAWRAARLMSNENASLSHVSALAASDQVLAASLLQVANSSLYSRGEPARTLDRAIAQIGFDKARRVLLALAARPLFASAKLQYLWRHSVEIAESAAALAQRVGMVPEEAYLAGLVHDIGRLVMERVPVFPAGLYTGLVEKGCPPVYAEALLAGCDHGAIAATVLRAWQFPADMAAAIRDHHRPELRDNRLSSLLYLAEWRAGGEEDLPSEARLRMALEEAGLKTADVESAALAAEWVRACA